VPQKNPLGNAISDGPVNCGPAAALGDDPAVDPAITVLALDDPVHPDKNAGKPAAAPAPRTDCTNLRRVWRN
jgi:hypothetical protein